MDLFTPIVPIDQQHPNFRTVTAPGFYKAERELLQTWADRFVDRDGKFVKEFQTTFNSGFWELYLSAAFRDLGFGVSFEHPSPDFELSGPSSFIAEAAIASHPSGFVPEWERELSFDALKKGDPGLIVELATIRLAGAIRAKEQKYIQSYSELGHVQGKPFVICVAPFEQPLSYVQSDQAIRRVLYGFDQPLFIDDEERRRRLIVGESLVERVQKESGATIEFSIFCRPGLEHVSAVIFSPIATWGKLRALVKEVGPDIVRFMAFRYAADELQSRVITAQRPDYEETLLDGLHVCVNPFATYPLNLRGFDRRDIAIHTFDRSTGQYHVQAEEGFLFFRQIASLRPTEEPGKVLEVGRKGPSAYRQYTPTPWPEAELIKVGGFVWPSDDTHMAHYRGWTVFIYRDTVDNDWGGQAVESACRDLPNFIRCNQDESIRSLLVDGFFRTKELAFRRAKQQVDELLDGPS